MREIKFRAWHKHEERMLKWNKELKGVITGGVKTISSFNTDNGWMDTYSYKEVELMQYTGLKDKNGKEIYEGDIVRVIHGNGYQTFKENVQVLWGKHGFSPMNWQYECDGCSIYCEILEIEVIGNIYENPELLESEGN